MSATDLYTVITPTKNILRDRPYVLALMRGVEENPAEFLGLVGSMDTTITDYNRLPESPLPDGLRHLPAIKPLLPEVPLIRPMIQSSNTAACRSFRSVLREISPLMERAEQKQPEPMVGFHIW